MADVQETRFAPFGGIGAEADCDATGRFRPGNTAALTTAAYSVRFWAGVSGVQAERRAAVLRDLGHGLDNAPEALLRAVDGLVQAVLLRDSAFLRIVESGGPTTLRGRRRAAFRVWCEASDRTEKHLRLVGLRREPRPAPTLSEYLETRAVPPEA